ncbi:MAG: hypothetical protein KDI33_21255 [Halioglobus sp.]|nr:hypothetical protein [Halioglobus sp.]
MPGNTEWAEIREVGFIAGMRFILWIYRNVGAWAIKFALQPVVFYYFITNGDARNSSLQFLHRVSLIDDAVKPTRQDVYRHLYSFAQSTVDKLGVWANSDILSNVIFENRELLLEQLESKRGAVLLGAHLGNMEICRSLSRANTKLKLNILVHTRHADMFNRLLKELHVESELELIEVTQLSPATAIRLAECVERGEFVAILADRLPVASNTRSRRVAFLGAEASFPEGPFILASLLKCPVYTIFCTRSGEGYRIRCDRFSGQVQLPRNNRDAALEKYISRYAAVLEHNVLRSPYQWFNFYSFWD